MQFGGYGCRGLAYLGCRDAVDFLGRELYGRVAGMHARELDVL